VKPSGVFLIAPDLLKSLGKTLPVFGLFLAGIRHVRRDVHQTDDRWIRPRFGDYRTAIAVRDENGRPIL